MKFKEGSVEVYIKKRPKVVVIRDIDLKAKNELYLESILKKLITNFSDFSIMFPMFHKNEEEYNRNIQVLPKLGFQLIMKKPVFVKKVKRQDENYLLTFKTLEEVKSKEPFRSLFYDSTKNSHFATMYVESLNPNQAFADHVINESKLAWNFLAYYKNKIVGFFCISRRDYLGKYGTLNHIAVDSKYRGKGFAKDMLKKIENEFYAAGITEWRESTDEKNIPMINAFLRIGFKKKKELLGFIYNPEIAFKQFL